MFKKWTNIEMLLLRTGQFEIKYLRIPKKIVIAQLKTVLKRSEDAIEKKLRCTSK